MKVDNKSKMKSAIKATSISATFIKSTAVRESFVVTAAVAGTKSEPVITTSTPSTSTEFQASLTEKFQNLALSYPAAGPHPRTSPGMLRSDLIPLLYSVYAAITNNVASILLPLMLLQHSLPVTAGSCREAQLCCNGRDSSCVVQKAPINAIIEDLNDKPCYCDHACLKLGDCCTDFKDHCGGKWIFLCVLDYLILCGKY